MTVAKLSLSTPLDMCHIHGQRHWPVFCLETSPEGPRLAYRGLVVSGSTSTRFFGPLTRENRITNSLPAADAYRPGHLCSTSFFARQQSYAGRNCRNCLFAES